MTTSTTGRLPTKPEFQNLPPVKANPVLDALQYWKKVDLQGNLALCEAISTKRPFSHYYSGF